MLKGLAITPPTLGRISIGKVVTNSNGQRLPQKDDEFTITSLVKEKGEWVDHPLDAALRSALLEGNTKKKLRRIPVRLLFNNPELSFRAEYSLFDTATGRPLCVGNGESCRRSTAQGIQKLECPSPEGCDLAQKKSRTCKPFGRLSVRIDFGEQQDELGSFIFRTTGFNSIRTLTARLEYFAAMSGNLLAYLPLDLVLRGKSTTQSHGAAVYFVDLTVRQGLTLAEAVAEAKKAKSFAEAAGLDQDALEQAVRKGLSNGAFEESEEDGPDLAEEFFPVTSTDGAATTNGTDAGTGTGTDEQIMVARKPAPAKASQAPAPAPDQQPAQQAAVNPQPQPQQPIQAASAVSANQVRYLENKASAFGTSLQAVTDQLGLPMVEAGVTSQDVFVKIKAHLSK